MVRYFLLWRNSWWLPAMWWAISIALIATPTRAAEANEANEADDLYAAAASSLKQRQFKVAIEEFQTFLTKYPSHLKADASIFYLGEALHRSGDYAEAGPYYRQYLTRMPQGKFATASLLRLGEAAHFIGNAEVAKTELERFRAKYPTDRLNAYVLLYLGEIALQEDDAASAAKILRQGLTTFPQSSVRDDYRYRLAQALKQQKRLQEAADLYGLVAQTPGSRLADNAIYELGVLEYARRDFAAAAEALAAFGSEPLLDSPQRPEAQLILGWALVELERLDEAKTLFEGLVSNEQHAITAQFWLGVVLRQQKDWVAAGKQFDAVIAAAPAGNKWIDDAIYGNTWVSLEAKDHEAVERHAAEFESRYPESPILDDVRRMLAESLLYRHEFAEAVKLLEPLATAGILDAKGLQDHYRLAECYNGLGRHEDGLAALLPVLDAAKPPLLLDAQLLQGSLLAGAGDYTEAKAVLTKFLATDPTGDALVRARGELAICEARSGRIADAQIALDQLVRDHGEHPLMESIIEQLAEAALAAGKTAANEADRQRWIGWSTELFGRLKTEGHSDDSQQKGLSGIAWSQWEAGELEKAAATFDELLQENPPEKVAAHAMLSRGYIFQELDQRDTALEIFDQVAQKYPKSEQYPQALWAAARLNDQMQKDREAAEIYKRLVDEFPEHEKLDALMYEWAWVLEDLGDNDQAGDLFEKLHAEHPQSKFWAHATFRLAQQAFLAKQYDRAKELTSEVLADSQDAIIREPALYLDGQIAVVQEDWQRVGESFRTLLKEVPDSSNRLVAEYWVAETLYRKAEYREARTLLDELAPKLIAPRQAWMAMVPLRQAQATAQLDDWNTAYQIASKIATDYPGFQQQYEADYLLGRCLAMRAEYESARASYQKVLDSPGGKKTETAAMAQLMIAESYFHQKDYGEALKQYLRVHSNYAYPAWQAAALLQAGKCQDLLGEPEAAEMLYDQLIRDYPGTEFARSASDRLAMPPSQRGSE